MNNRLWVIGFVIAALLPLWFKLGGVPVGARSDGRYAAVSRDLSQRENWLIPYGPEGPHLTKPPLTYWAEAACIRVMGPTAAAVRVPSALAGSLVVIGTLLLGWKIAGKRVGLLAAGILAVMPLHLVVSRLTLTDGILAIGWFGVVAGGYLCIVEPRNWRWPLLLWGSMAIGWMAKGPVAWIPLGAIFLWLIVGKRAKEIWKLRPISGGLLSLIPVAAWAAAVWLHDSAAVVTWQHEVGGRLAGGGNHPQGPWYFLLVLIVGMFPATCMLDLPLLNHPWRRTWEKIRRGENSTYWAWLVVVPLIVFSIPSGKLASYILPLCPPLALATALMLERWLTGENDKPSPGVKPPEVKGTLLIVTALCTVGAIVAAIIVIGRSAWWVALPFAAVPLACTWLMLQWRKRELRAAGLFAVWCSIVLAVLWGEAMAERFVAPHGTPAMLATLEQKTELRQPMLTPFRHDDNSLSFYTGRFVQRTNTADDLNEQVAQFGRSLVVAAEEGDWKSLQDASPQIAGKFEQVMAWPLWPEKQNLLLLRPISDVTPR